MDVQFSCARAELVEGFVTEMKLWWTLYEWHGGTGVAE